MSTGLRRRQVLPFAVAILAVAVVTAVAFAAGPSSRAQVQDPNDTRGLLDVRRVWFEPEIHPPRWTVVTYLPFSAEQTRERGYVFVYLDTFGDEGFDYYAMILSNGRHLSSSLWREPRRGPDVRLMGLVVRHDSDTEVSVRIPLGQLGCRRVPDGVSVVGGHDVRRAELPCHVHRPRSRRGHVRATDRFAHADPHDVADRDADAHTDAHSLTERGDAALSGIRTGASTRPGTAAPSCARR